MVSWLVTSYLILYTNWVAKKQTDVNVNQSLLKTAEKVRILIIVFQCLYNLNDLALDHIFNTDITACCQQNRYVRLAICTDSFPLIRKLRYCSEKQYMHWSQFIHQNWNQTFERKLVYIVRLTVQDMVLDSNFQQIASGRLKSFWCFNAIFNAIIFLMFPLPFLNMFLLAGYVKSKVT